MKDSLKVTALAIPLLVLSVPALAANTYPTGTYGAQFATLGYSSSFTNDFNEAITFGAGGAISTSFNATFTNYDGVEDNVVLVLNNSGHSIANFSLSNPGTPIYGFDGDGIAAYTALGGNVVDTTGYGGNNAYFTNINGALDSGFVNFLKPIADGSWGYFSLEEAANLNQPGTVGQVPLPGALPMFASALAAAGLMFGRKNRKPV